MKSKFILPIICIVGVSSISCNSNQNTSMDQPTLQTRTVSIIEQDGFEFKDLNRNGELDPYEDWRLTPEQRSKDLLGRMSLEEKAGMMLIADMRMSNEAFMLEQVVDQKPITSDFNEADIVVDKNQFTGEPLPYPLMNTFQPKCQDADHHSYQQSGGRQQ